MVSMEFSELYKFLKCVMIYCDAFKEIKYKREQVKLLEIELEQSINELHNLNIDKNQLELELSDLRQHHIQATNEKHALQSQLEENEVKLVREN